MPRALPISRFMRGCTVNKWKKKSGLNDLVQAEIRKTRKGNPREATSLRPRVGSSRRPLDKVSKHRVLSLYNAMFGGNAGQVGLGSSRPESSRPGSTRPGHLGLVLYITYYFQL